MVRLRGHGRRAGQWHWHVRSNTLQYGTVEYKFAVLCDPCLAITAVREEVQMVVTASLLVLLLFAGCASFGWGLESEAGSRLAVAPVSSSSSTLGSFDDNGLYKIAIERSRVEPDAGLQEVCLKEGVSIS